jgi:hypothetical protein
MEHKGRFIDEIINGIWCICEETTWAINAHAFKVGFDEEQDPLPWGGHETLALFSLQTGAILMETDYLLGKELENVSRALRVRLHDQVMRRIIETFENHSNDDCYLETDRPLFWWLSGRNNWTPWCCDNLLNAAMHILDDTERLCAIAVRLIEAVDRFIGNYKPDGGCDEGPGYWTVAAGTMLRFLELLHSRSNGAIDIYGEKLIREMGKFITRAYIDVPWAANFADASPRLGIPRAVTYRFGERVDSDCMKQLVLMLMRTGNGHTPPIQPHMIMHMVRELFWIPPDPQEGEFIPEPETWLPDLQFMVSRDTVKPKQGLVCTAKGGHNGENHNHNDVGSFIIFSNGEPVIIDVGTEHYTRFTFSKTRYDLWTHRSLGHNVPYINDYEQAPGIEYKADDVCFASDNSSRTLSMDLAKAYPEKARVASAVRTVSHLLDSPSHITVTDEIQTEKSSQKVIIPLYSPCKPEKEEPGKIVFYKDQPQLILTFDPNQIKVKVTPRKMIDKKLFNEWGLWLYRIELTARSKGSNIKVELDFRQA